MLGAVHPLPKMALCLVWIGAAIVVFDLRFQLVTLGLAAGLLVLTERVRLRVVLALMVPFALFGFGFFTTSVVFRQETGFAAQMAQEQALARADVAPGLVLFFRAIACGMVSALFALTTDPGALVRALMQQMRLPPRVGYALLQAMHLVPDLAREAAQLRLARAMRLGRSVPRIPRPAEVVALMVPLLAFAIRRAGRAAIAMEARGLAPGRNRSWARQEPIRPADWAFAAAGLLLLAGLIAGLARL